MTNYNKLSVKHFISYFVAKQKQIRIWKYRLSISRKVKKIRKKDKINVVFVIFELGSWKTETLYSAMLEHKRFNPILLLSPSLENLDATYTLRDYLDMRQYKYKYAGDYYNLECLNPDIIIYQKDYKSCYMLQHWCEHNTKYLYCFHEYGLHTISDSLWCNMQLNAYLWQSYFENEDAASSFMKFSRYPDSITITGYLPFDNLFSSAKENPWKKSGSRKKIIYAPHHSFKEDYSPGIQYATFLEYGEFMLELAQKYKGKVQWAFKPHPRMYDKLVKIWGKEKTEKYYMSWDNLEYGQVELGIYDELFKTSDALIHDCSSFTVEYHATNKPVLFLLNRESESQMDNLQPYARKAFDLHYKAYARADIEKFVVNVIEGKDELKTARTEYCNQYLRPPYGKTACENIINAILGVEEFAEK